MNGPLSLLADEDFDNDIVRGLRRRLPHLDLVRVQDVALGGQPDTAVLAWVAQEQRIVVTHDASTMEGAAYERVGQGLAMPGVFVVSQSIPIGQAIEDLLLVLQLALIHI